MQTRKEKELERDERVRLIAKSGMAKRMSFPQIYCLCPCPVPMSTRYNNFRFVEYCDTCKLLIHSSLCREDTVSRRK